MSLTWVFITGGASHGKVDLIGVDGVDDDVWARQGDIRSNTHSEFLEDPWKSVRSVEGSVEGDLLVKFFSCSKEPRERGKSMQKRSFLALAYPRDITPC